MDEMEFVYFCMVALRDVDFLAHNAEEEALRQVFDLLGEQDQESVSFEDITTGIGQNEMVKELLRAQPGLYDLATMTPTTFAKMDTDKNNDIGEIPDPRLPHHSLLEYQ